MSDSQAIYFYSRHPISAEIILAKLLAARGHLDGVTPDELFPHDQDHYGGLGVNDELARAAGIGQGTRVADFCAGLGGPARYLASRYGADVTGLELTPARVVGAAQLTQLVGLQESVRVIEADVTRVPLPDRSVDAVVSQEALLHVGDKAGALTEAFRILRPGGRLAFTDWILHRPLEAAEAQLLWDGMAAQTLQTLASYRAMLADIGFENIAETDLTVAWSDILRERMAMFQKLRRDAEALGTPPGHDAFHESYVLFVALIQERAMGGARFSAVKPG